MLKWKVPDMSCGHCAATIEKAARSVDPAAEVDVDLTTNVATIATIAPIDRVREMSWSPRIFHFDTPPMCGELNP